MKHLFFILLLGFLFPLTNDLHAQGPYFKVISIKKPCYKDGEIILVIKGAQSPYALGFCLGDTGNYYYDTFYNDTLKFTNLMGGARQGYISINGYDALKKNIDTSFQYQSPLSIASINVMPDTCPKNTGAISLVISGGTSPYTYKWNDHSSQTTATASNLKSGNYICIVKDANGCGFDITSLWDSCSPNKSRGIFVPQISGITLTNKITLNGCLSDSLYEITTTGGQSPYNYLWQPGLTTSAKKTITKPDTLHLCAVTDNNGCTENLWAYPRINFNALAASVKIYPDTCGRENGAIALTITNGKSPYSYKWQDGQTTATVKGLKPGNHSVLITDARGCMSQFNYNVPSTPVLNATFTIKEANCSDSSGSVTTNVSGGKTPYSYIWSNGETTASISKLPSNQYTLQIKDNSGCNQLYKAWVGYINPMKVVDSFAHPTNCGTNDGVIDFYKITGATGTIKFTWYGNGTLPITSSSSNNLPEGYYGIYINDSKGCVAWRSFTLRDPAKCQGTISGTLYADINKNNTFDPGDKTFRNVAIYGTNTASKSYSTITNRFTGAYTLYHLNPSTYDVSASQTLPKFWEVSSPSSKKFSLSISAGSNLTGNDFVVQPTKNIRNLGVQFNYWPAFRPGFTTDVDLEYRNEGVATLNTTVTVQYDALLSLSSCKPAFTSHDATKKIITFDLKNLAPLAYDNIKLVFSTPSSASLGKMVRISAYIDTTKLDDDSLDNIAHLDRQIVGSYDPNDKKVSPDGPEGKIPFGNQTLTYTVQFQNTGTYPAEFVIIRDTLDNKIESTSVKVIGTSHAMKLHQENNVLKFHFENINLPDSGSNPEGSIGFVTYSVNLKGPTPGINVKNKAYIYFDYNEPIITNTTSTTLVLAGVREFENGTDNILVSPNPNNGSFVLKSLNMGICRAEITDLSGRIHWSSSDVNTVEEQKISALNLNTGMYIITLNNGSKTVSQKFMVKTN